MPTSSDYPLAWIVLGVSGSGKSTVGRLLAAELECDFCEGDRRHPRENIAKMFHQIPLTDADRRDWLKSLHHDIANAVKTGREIVVSCSGLRVAYRKRLAQPGRVRFVYIDVPEAELLRRLRKRKGHYFKASMLASQLASFEPLRPDEPAFIVDGIDPADVIVKKLLDRAKRKWPILRETWWRRFVGSKQLRRPNP